MSQSAKKTIRSFLSTFFVCFITTGIVFYLSRGVPLYGMPDSKDIAFVEVRDVRLSSESRRLTSPEDISNARNVASLLNYWLGVVQDEEPVISITYCLKNGETVDVSASEDMVFWMGKARKIRDGDMFINIVEGLFFMDMVYDN